MLFGLPLGDCVAVSGDASYVSYRFVFEICDQQVVPCWMPHSSSQPKSQSPNLRGSDCHPLGRGVCGL